MTNSLVLKAIEHYNKPENWYSRIREDWRFALKQILGEDNFDNIIADTENPQQFSIVGTDWILTSFNSVRKFQIIHYQYDLGASIFVDNFRDFGRAMIEIERRYGFKSEKISANFLKKLDRNEL